MSYTLGIDIGTYESKGVLVDRAGKIVAAASQAHKMIVPQPGWAEHRAEENCGGVGWVGGAHGIGAGHRLTLSG